MKKQPTPRDLPHAQALAERAFHSLERFLHIEAASGVVLLIAAAIALIWVNSPFIESYHTIWEAQLSIGLGKFHFSRSLHFWINDGLMTLFFLVVGMEIRREIHTGALSNVKQMMLPLLAALGGVLLPALIFLGFNAHSMRQQGWAIPTATDIAFAVGVLALLGSSIPRNVRVFLLTLAIIDDIIAVLIIALFYSGGLNYSGFLIAALGIMLVFGLQRIGIGCAFAYVIPGIITWIGFLITGAHPTLSGIVLGLITPVVSVHMRERPSEIVSRIASELTGQEDEHQITKSRRQLQLAQRELQPPIIRVQKALHPWVAYVVMPLFALANAGVQINSNSFAAEGAMWIIVGIMTALVIGKPLGVVGMSWISVRCGWCQLPPGVNWKNIWLIGLLAGIGFTMSIFIAMLAFNDASWLTSAKLGVLLGSFIAAVMGIAWGKFGMRRL
jgi:NhaA family Na+:H+ antiporter